MQTSDPNPFISTREASQMLGVALRTVQLWVESGVLHAWKTAGGHRRVVRASVDALLAQREAALAQGGQGERSGSKPARKLDSMQDRVLRVLIIEPDGARMEPLRSELARARLPVEMHIAASGFAALLQIGALRPHVFACDLELAGMDAFQMLRELCAASDFANVAIAVWTSMSRQTIADRGGLPVGVQVLAKPLPLGALQELLTARAVAHAIERQRAVLA